MAGFGEVVVVYFLLAASLLILISRFLSLTFGITKRKN
jgi:hypothetical protein